MTSLCLLIGEKSKPMGQNSTVATAGFWAINFDLSKNKEKEIGTKTMIVRILLMATVILGLFTATTACGA